MKTSQKHSLSHEQRPISHYFKRFSRGPAKFTDLTTHLILLAYISYTCEIVLNICRSAISFYVSMYSTNLKNQINVILQIEDM